MPDKSTKARHLERSSTAEQTCNAPNPLYAEKTFIDLFAGAGCLSLGLMASGWRGLLAVEKDPMAFETLRYNLIDGRHGFQYEWPDWFPQKPCTVGRFARRYREQLNQLRGKVAMIVGGPPCQGFSFAGRRNKADSRNSLFRSYMQVVETIEPLVILLENVHGIAVEFGKRQRSMNGTRVGRPAVPYSQRIAKALTRAGYVVHAGLLRAADYGVPQLRPRYFLIAVRQTAPAPLLDSDPFKSMIAVRDGILLSKGLPIDRAVSVKEAISDLETSGSEVVPCSDAPRSMQGSYSPPSTLYQHLMRYNVSGCFPDSHRLANHLPETVKRFAEILATCRRGTQLSKADRERLGLRKKCTVPLDPAKPSLTLTTLPDDMIHYAEPRILTVREYARLQSIPDWFQFRGKYTTGGDRRTRECPRYTQAGNAVPPFLGEALGTVLGQLHADYLKTHAPEPERDPIEAPLVGVVGT
ncbi:MAG: DNA cytosine methyltransferase [Dehalococcoidia bacterium]|nr:DNA cytosine methyltransferase [Dehalococcoidia bacterium]